MLKVRTVFSYSIPEDLRFTPAGIAEVPVYSVRLDDRGTKEVYRSGSRNLYEIIQADLEQSKVQNIVRRALGGDPVALAQRYGEYMDVSALPDNMIDISNLAIKLRADFDAMPADIRQKFDNSVDRFVALYGTAEWADLLGINKTVTTEPVEGGAPVESAS